MKVFVLAVVGCGSQQDELTGMSREQSSQLKALGIFDLGTEIGRRHFVRLIDNDQVPVYGGQFSLDIDIAAEFVESGDAQVVLLKPVTRSGGSQSFIGQYLKRETELFIQFILPLFHQTTGSDDEAAVNIPSNQQLFDQEPGHDGLTGPRIIRQQEP